MKYAIVWLALGAFACGDDAKSSSASNNTANPQNNAQNNAQSSPKWTATGDLEAEGILATVQQVDTQMVLRLSAQTGVLSIALEGVSIPAAGTTFVGPQTLTTNDAATVTLVGGELNCGQTPAATPHAEVFTVVLEDLADRSAKGTFSGTLPCEGAEPATFEGQFDF